MTNPWLKLRCAYHKWRCRAADDDMALIEGIADCGRDLLRYMSKPYAQAEQRFEKHCKWLEENDPEYPKDAI